MFRGMDKNTVVEVEQYSTIQRTNFFNYARMKAQLQISSI